MNLKYPDSEVKFKVTPSFFLGGFNVYDREESLENKLNLYNPNNPVHLKKLMQEYFFNTKRIERLDQTHKEELKRVLLTALESPEFNFESLLEDNDEECFYLPSAWNIENPRRFFETIYEILREQWYT